MFDDGDGIADVVVVIVVVIAVVRPLLRLLLPGLVQLLLVLVRKDPPRPWGLQEQYDNDFASRWGGVSLDCSFVRALALRAFEQEVKSGVVVACCCERALALSFRPRPGVGWAWNSVASKPWLYEFRPRSRHRLKNPRLSPHDSSAETHPIAGPPRAHARSLSPAGVGWAWIAVRANPGFNISIQSWDEVGADGCCEWARVAVANEPYLCVSSTQISARFRKPTVAPIMLTNVGFPNRAEIWPGKVQRRGSFATAPPPPPPPQLGGEPH